MRVSRFNTPDPVLAEGPLVNICGALLHARSQKLDALRDHLSSLEGVELHAVQEDGRMVVTVEDTEDNLAMDRLRQIGDMDGILSVSLVFHQFEPKDSLDIEEVIP